MRKYLRNTAVTITQLTIAIAFFIVTSTAATFTVTNISDSGAGSLRQAILDAAAAPGGDVINFDASFNVPKTITLGGTQLLITGNGSLTINGPGMNLLTVSGNNASRVFEISGIDSPSIGTVTINNLTITRGFQGPSGSGLGAGIGINNIGTSSAVTSVPVIVSNVVFRNNNGGVNDGGGIGCTRAGSIVVNNSVFTGNTANGGGAMANGSGIGQCSSVTINDSSFYENQTTASGAGLTISFGGNPSNGVYTISGCSFYNNGNAGVNNTVVMQSSATTSTITNSTFFDNRNIGATIALSLGSWTLTNVTVTRNRATSNNPPAGIQLGNGALLNIGNSIVSGNTGPNGENNFLTNTTGLISQGYNIFGPSNDATINGNTTGNQLGVDPGLDSLLRDNGGPTKTVALRPGSLAIDTGNPATLAVVDQRGVVRPQDGDGVGGARSDIGAYERRTIDVVPAGRVDFDGDGKTDISIYRPSLGEWWFSRSSTGVTGALQFGVSTDKLVPADFTGDGKTDIAFFRPSTGFWYVLRSEDYSFFSFPFGTNGDIPVTGDFDGDGKNDPAVFRPSNTTWFLSLSGGGTRIINFGATGDVPVPADYDGDGKADVAIFRPSVGEWWINRSSTGLTTAFQFGTSTDKIVPGDYTGDGKTDAAFFRPSTGFWFIQRSEDNSFFSFPFGASGDVPAPGDYDADGKFDATVFRPSNVTWYSSRSTAGVLIANFGSTGDIAVPNSFVP